VRLVLGATALIATGYALAFAGETAARAGAWLLAVGLAALMPATMALGVPGRGPRSRIVRVALWGTFVALLAAFGAALALPAAEASDSPLFFGLPLRAAIVVYGAGVLPLVVLPLVYVWSFPAVPHEDAREPTADRPA
jgi:hypothetical protein